MSQWNTQFSNNKLLEALRECADIASRIEIEGFDDKAKAGALRLMKVLPWLLNRFEKIDPEFYHPNTWGQINSWMTQVQSHMKSYAGNKNTAHLQNANANLDEILMFLKINDLSLEVKDAEAFAKAFGAPTEAYVNLSKALEQDLNRLRAELTKFDQRAGEFSTSLDNQKARLDQNIAEYQKQFAAGQQERQQGMKELIDTNAFALAKAIQAGEAQFKDVAEKVRESFKAQEVSIRERADENLKILQEMEDKARRIVNVIGNVSTSGDFKNTADSEGRAANIFRRWAIFLMIAAGTVAVWAFWESVQQGADWRLFAMRLVTSIMIIIPATYTAQESNKHRAGERANRKLQLELESIDAYLISLPEAKRNEIKAGLTDKFFGQSEPADTKEQITKHALFDLVSDALKALTKTKS